MNSIYVKLGYAGAVITSLIVLVAFTGLCVLILFYEPPAGSRDLANILFGSLAVMAANVVNFWVGSSSSSMQKTAMAAEPKA